LVLGNLNHIRARLRWQDPAVPDAVMGPGWRKWIECPPLGQFTQAGGVPGLMVQGWSWSSLDYAMLHSFATKLADELPIGIVIDESKFQALGNWEPHGGAPVITPVELPAPQPSPETFRTFHMGDVAFKSMTLTAEDFADRDRLRARNKVFLESTGQLRPEDQ
jgi:hypothetical protein